MKSLIAVAALIAPLYAHAVDLEFGYGKSWAKDMGDGVWYQQGVPHAETLGTRTYLIGLADNIREFGPWSVRWHASYVYFGGQSASCMCVPDTAYDPRAHIASTPGYIPFNGAGHVQGVALTLDAGYTMYGVRFAAEAGPWVFWNTWHVSRVDPEYPDENDVSHRTVAQLGWLAGLRIESGPTSLSYRYYTMPQRWNPYPGLVTGTHMLMLIYKF